MKMTIYITMGGTYELEGLKSFINMMSLSIQKENSKHKNSMLTKKVACFEFLSLHGSCNSVKHLFLSY